MWDAKTIAGTAEQVVTRLEERRALVAADEVMILNLGHTPSAILRSTELIADAYGMPKFND